MIKQQAEKLISREMKDEVEGWWWYWCWKIDSERLGGFAERQVMDICDCRVAFANES